MVMIRNLLVGIGFALTLGTPTAASAQLQDGTTVHVRLVSPITSESARAGDTINFVVTRDVVVNGAVVIARGTPAVGSVVAARRAIWGFIDHHPVLSLAFVKTTAVDGQLVRLRAANAYGQVNIDRSDHHHYLQWATEGDTFEALVAGEYVLGGLK
jgi:hypothetical protein